MVFRPNYFCVIAGTVDLAELTKIIGFHEIGIDARHPVPDCPQAEATVSLRTIGRNKHHE
jgi:hypothetical protein